MSQEQPMQDRSVAVRPPIRVRFDQLKRSPGLRVIGIPELIGLAGAGLIVLITIFAYVYFLVPAKSRRAAAQLEKDRLQGQLLATRNNFRQGTTAQADVNKIKASLEDFESNWLAPPASGRMTLYRELNALIRSNGLRNTAGPNYTPLPPVGTKTAVQPTATASQQSNAKWQAVYPGIAVSVTVEGPYQNVRHFVRDIEISRRFLVINAVELEGVTQTGAVQGLSTTPVASAVARSSSSPTRAARSLPTPVRRS